MTVEKTSYGEYAIVHNQNEIAEAQEVMTALLKCDFVIRYKEYNNQLFDLIREDLSKSNRKLNRFIEFQKPNEVLDLNCTLKINY